MSTVGLQASKLVDSNPSVAVPVNPPKIYPGCSRGIPPNHTIQDQDQRVALGPHGLEIPHTTSHPDALAHHGVGIRGQIGVPNPDEVVSRLHVIATMAERRRCEISVTKVAKLAWRGRK